MPGRSLAQRLCITVGVVVSFAGCKHKSGGAHDAAVANDLGTNRDLAPPPDFALPTACNGSVKSVAAAGATPTVPAGLTVPSGFSIMNIATVSQARQLAALPNGDLLVGSSNSQVIIIPNAEGSGATGTPTTFAALSDEPAQGVAFSGSNCTVYFATQHGVYSAPYTDGMLTVTTPNQIAMVRQGTPTPSSDGDVHTTSSVVVAGGQVYVGVGSGCNACVEVDPTRATIQQMGLAGQNMTTKATRLRNAIGMAVNPETGTVFAGGAGQDDLPTGHPYEFFDAVTSHSGEADYGWPDCEENQHAYTPGSDCSATVQPIIELPAYSTIIGGAYYPATAGGTYAFPAAYRSGLFLSAHGSWHEDGVTGLYLDPPHVVFVPMNGDKPVTAVDWTDPTKQWTEFVDGFETTGSNTRIGRPSGVAVGAQGSLFVADDQNGVVYRIRPQ